MWSELISRPTPSILLVLIGAAFILCLWAFLSQRRVTRASAGDRAGSSRSHVAVTPSPAAQRRPQPTFAPPAQARPFPTQEAPQATVPPPHPTAAPSPSPAIVSSRAADTPTPPLPAREVSGSVEIKKPQPVPCALSVAATLAAVEAKRADAIKR